MGEQHEEFIERARCGESDPIKTLVTYDNSLFRKLIVKAWLRCLSF